MRGLEIARDNGVTTILNPAPGRELPDAVLGALRLPHPERDRGGGADRACRSATAEAARAAAERLRERGVGTVVMTLGARGALLHGQGRSALVPAIAAGPVVETTGAGDAFNGGFATGLARGMDPWRGGALRLRRRRHLGDPAGHRALDADARRGRGAAGARLTLEGESACVNSGLCDAQGMHNALLVKHSGLRRERGSRGESRTTHRRIASPIGCDPTGRPCASRRPVRE